MELELWAGYPHGPVIEIAIKRSLNLADFDFSPEDIHRLALDTGFTVSRQFKPVAK